MIVWDSDSVDVLGFSVPEPAFCLYRDPVIELFFVLFHSFVLFEFHDLLCDEVVGFAGFSDEIFWEEVVIFGEGEIGL